MTVQSLPRKTVPNIAAKAIHQRESPVEFEVFGATVVVVVVVVAVAVVPGAAVGAAVAAVVGQTWFRFDG